MVMQSIDARTTMSALMLGLQETCHDMRQPVASVFALAAAALSQPDLPQPARAYLEQIVEQAEWLADLIQQSLPAAGPGAPAGCQTDLLRVVRDAVAAECLTWPGDLRVAGEAEPVFTAVHAAFGDAHGRGHRTRLREDRAGPRAWPERGIEIRHRARRHARLRMQPHRRCTGQPVAAANGRRQDRAAAAVLLAARQPP